MSIRRLACLQMRFLTLMAFAPLAGCLAWHAGPMPGEPKDATFTDIEGTRVRFLDRGQGPVVVLIHGFASSLETWSLLMPALVASGHRVIALDLKGFGWTDRPQGDYSPEAQARLVFSLLDQRGVARAAVVGHSWGASVALAMTLAHPGRVSRLVLYDAWAYDEQLPTFFHWARTGGLGELLFWLWYDERADERIALAFYDPRFVSEKLVEEVDRSMKRPGTKAAALAAVRGQRYRRMQDRYRTIQQPALLLWGREDVVTTPAYGERLLRELPGARMVVYPQCGHFPMIEAAAASTAEVLTFLAPDRAAAREEPDEDPDDEPAKAGPADATP